MTGRGVAMLSNCATSRTARRDPVIDAKLPAISWFATSFRPDQQDPSFGIITPVGPPVRVMTFAIENVGLCRDTQRLRHRDRELDPAQVHYVIGGAPADRMEVFDTTVQHQEPSTVPIHAGFPAHTGARSEVVVARAHAGTRRVDSAQDYAVQKNRRAQTESALRADRSDAPARVDADFHTLCAVTLGWIVDVVVPLIHGYLMADLAGRIVQIVAIQPTGGGHEVETLAPRAQ